MPAKHGSCKAVVTVRAPPSPQVGSVIGCRATQTPATLSRMADTDHIQYQLIAARRLQWDNLVWQVPVLSLTAQAFLFVTALGGGDRWSRVIASLLSLAVSFLSITLMARHRQAELADAHCLAEYERNHFGSEWHGPVFQDARDSQGLEAGWIGRVVPKPPGFITWVLGLSLFGVAALVAFIRALTG